MTEEEKQQSEPGKVDDATPNYIATIKELKENRVDRKDYDKVIADNKSLLKMIVDGQKIEVPAQPVEKPDIQKLRQEAFKDNQTNLEYVSHILELRKAIIESGSQDPFLPVGEKTLPTDADVQTAERVANVLQECVDLAEGDSQVFTNELMRRTVDTGPIRRK